MCPQEASGVSEYRGPFILLLETYMHLLQILCVLTDSQMCSNEP